MGWLRCCALLAATALDLVVPADTVNSSLLRGNDPPGSRSIAEQLPPCKGGSQRYFYNVQIDVFALSPSCYPDDLHNIGVLLGEIIKECELLMPEYRGDYMKTEVCPEPYPADARRTLLVDESHRKLGLYSYRGGGICRRCTYDNVDRRELLEADWSNYIVGNNDRRLQDLQAVKARLEEDLEEVNTRIKAIRYYYKRAFLWSREVLGYQWDELLQEKKKIEEAIKRVNEIAKIEENMEEEIAAVLVASMSAGLQDPGTASAGLLQDQDTASAGLLQDQDTASAGLQDFGSSSAGLEDSGSSSDGIEGSGSTLSNLEGSSSTSTGLQGSGSTSNVLQGSDLTSSGLQGTVSSKSKTKKAKSKTKAPSKSKKAKSKAKLALSSSVTSISGSSGLDSSTSGSSGLDSATSSSSVLGSPALDPSIYAALQQDDGLRWLNAYELELLKIVAETAAALGKNLPPPLLKAVVYEVLKGEEWKLLDEREMYLIKFEAAVDDTLSGMILLAATNTSGVTEEAQQKMIETKIYKLERIREQMKELAIYQELAEKKLNSLEETADVLRYVLKTYKGVSVSAQNWNPSAETSDSMESWFKKFGDLLADKVPGRLVELYKSRYNSTCVNTEPSILIDIVEVEDVNYGSLATLECPETVVPWYEQE